jgi:hypothetical protein
MRKRRGGRAVECGGLENRFGLLGPTRVQIPPPPLHTSVERRVETRRSAASPAPPATDVLGRLLRYGAAEALADGVRVPALVAASAVAER